MKGLLRRIWHEERGGTTLTLAWFMIAALVFAVGLDAFFGIYIAHQQLRTAAIAGAEAVSRAITDEAVLPPAVEEEAERRVDKVEVRADEIIAEWLERCVLDCVLEESDWISAYRIAFQELYDDPLDQDMAEKILDGTWEDEPAHVKMNKLIPDNGDLACLIRDAADDNESFIRSEVKSLVEANGATLEKLTLLDSDGWSHVQVSRPVKPFGAAWLFPDANYPKLTVGQMSRIRQIGENRTPAWSSPCRGSG